jgi:hypothetical protein
MILLFFKCWHCNICATKLHFSIDSTVCFTDLDHENDSFFESILTTLNYAPFDESVAIISSSLKSNNHKQI